MASLGCECECGESRKKQTDGARLNPKRLFIMGNQQPRRKRKVQRSVFIRRIASYWQFEMAGTLSGEDMIYDTVKAVVRMHCRSSVL